MDNPSLIPYLAGSGSHISLEISAYPSLLSHDEETSRFTFGLVSDTGPLSRILVASVKSDAGNTLKPVFLLLSRDDYRCVNDRIGSLTNPDIEASWQSAFRNRRKNGSITTVSAQVDASGDLVPFRSLFFCKRRKQFFHPSCPYCGQALELCKNDETLKQAGLKSYSTSLKRYLTCTVCGSSRKAFYAYIPDSTDPVAVKGLADLIMGFGELKTGDLPCLACSERQACYGDKQVLSLMIPVAFYPFYMLICEAASLNALDFLSLISGEPFEDLEQGLAEEGEYTRQRYVRLLKEHAVSGLLFAEDERCFLEILYLKLSFLGEVARYVLSGAEKSGHPEFGPSLARMWVRIDDQSSLLPAYWNFQLVMSDMDLEIPEVFPISGAYCVTHVLGILWFHALLRNRTQDLRAINRGLTQMLKERETSVDKPIFQPENIFWEPRPVPQKWRGLWEKALGLGGAILVEAEKGTFAEQKFWYSYDELRDEIRRELFAPVAQAAPEVAQEEKADNTEIGRILKGIRTRWAKTSHPEKVEKFQETMVISSPGAQSAQPEAVLETVILAPEKAPVLEEASETIVLPSQPAPPAIEEDFSTETVIMEHSPISALVKPADAMQETVLIGPERAKPAVQTEASLTPGGDDLTETVIMGAPTQVEPALSPKAPTLKDDDGLAETVILKPQKQ